MVFDVSDGALTSTDTVDVNVTPVVLKGGCSAAPGAAAGANAAAVAASGVVSMAFIVVLAIYSSSGDLAAGLIKTLVFGLVGIAAQALSVRLIGAVKGLDIGEMLEEEKFSPVVLDVAGYEIVRDLKAGEMVWVGKGRVPHNIGHLFLAIDPAAFRDAGEFEDDVDEVLDTLRNSEPADAARPVQVAGDPERRAREERVAAGIPMPETLLAQLRGIAENAGVPCTLGEG